MLSFCVKKKNVDISKPILANGLENGPSLVSIGVD